MQVHTVDDVPAHKQAQNACSQEAAMRNFIVVSSVIALAVALASLTPKPWTNFGRAGGTLPSISVHDLTLASGSLTTQDYADAH